MVGLLLQKAKRDRTVPNFPVLPNQVNSLRKPSFLLASLGLVGYSQGRLFGVEAQLIP
jgi:hypothetical protein